MRANQWPLIGETLFSVVPPSNSLVSVSDPWRFFELTRCSSMAIDSPRALLPELQRYKDTDIDWCGTQVPGHRQKQLTKTLIVRLLKMHFYTLILDFEKSTEYIWVSDWTWSTLIMGKGDCRTLPATLPMSTWDFWLPLWWGQTCACARALLANLAAKKQKAKFSYFCSFEIWFFVKFNL